METTVTLSAANLFIRILPKVSLTVSILADILTNRYLMVGKFNKCHMTFVNKSMCRCNSINTQLI